jgi:hypothetical protein
MQGKIPKDHTSLFLRILSLEPPGTLHLFWKTLTMRLTMKLQKKMIPQPPKVNDPKKDSEIKNEVGKS